ncbi:MAG: hypothetical protein QXY21_02290 [Candidatus Micrarchaeaceae archaeon]
MPSAKKKKIDKELEKINKAQAVTDVINKSDLETLLLDSSLQDSTVHPDQELIDTRINELAKRSKNYIKDMHIVEHLSNEKVSISKSKNIAVKSSKKGSSIKRHMHIKKTSKKVSAKYRKK